MHKMSTPLHKNTETKQEKNISTSTSKVSNNNSNAVNDNGGSLLSSTMDLERENRLSKVMSLYSKGLNQQEIASEIKVNQSTASRDLVYIKRESRCSVDKYMKEDVLFEYDRYFVGHNEIIKKLWQIADASHTDPKDRIRALALLNQANDKRYDRLIGGPDAYLKIKQSQSDLVLQEFIDSNPEVKASMDMGNLLSNSSVNKNKRKNDPKSYSQDIKNLYSVMKNI